MNLDEMLDAIESTNLKNVWLLIEAESNAISRFKLRATFFEALQVLNIPSDADLL